MENNSTPSYNENQINKNLNQKSNSKSSQKSISLSAEDFFGKIKNFVSKAGEKFVEKISLDKPYIKSWNSLFEIYINLSNGTYSFEIVKNEVSFHFETILSSILEEWDEYYNTKNHDTEKYFIRILHRSLYRISPKKRFFFFFCKNSHTG
ncbi:hypothetical protein AYI68_g4549 [Smittium mucronatum]|uniref:Uncharacterized protein n=1 Tax=Smittium mucronatum TaxID=133383 RepID=A0A1R0GWS5_9FUNG|nr:hypothetical protein AYI68_g4549 [Smittium mucronatum]